MTDEVAERIFMQIGSVGLCEYDNEYKSSKASKGEKFDYSQGEQLQEDIESRVLGIGFLKEPGTDISYGMKASYAKDYSEENPVIEVSVTKGQNNIEKYYINIREVNPSNATEIEMFALCNYADANGMGTGGTFGSWQTLNYYRRNANFNGEFMLTNTTDLCSSFKQNWIAMVDSVMQVYNAAGLYEQGLDGNKLLSIFKTSNYNINEDMQKDGKNNIEIIHNRIEELYTKIVNGETQPSIPIGAGEFTEKEWDKLIEQFDKVQEEFKKEIEEAKGEEVKEQEVRKSVATESIQKEDEKDVIKEENIQTLVSQSTTCTYPASDDNKEKGFYIICYTTEGISCKGPNQMLGDGYLWEIKFDNAGQYRKVINFINKFDNDDNLRFAANNDFWKDFLDEKIDEDDFVSFYKSSDNVVGKNTPEEVRYAWIEAALEVGTDGFGVSGNGMLTHISQMMIKRLNNLMKNSVKEPKSILGNSVESAIRITEQALYDLENPLLKDDLQSNEIQQYVENERAFYHAFLDKLKELIQSK